MWKDVEPGFKAAFELEWEAYRSGTVPIGAAILNEAGEVVATGRNQINAKGEGLISNHQLAHAEINAILKLPEDKFPDIREYTLYTTCEPCPLCFGAIVMGSIKKVKFAQRDPWAGASEMNGSTAYLVRKRINFEGPFAELERVSATLGMCFEFETNGAAYMGNNSYSKFIDKFQAFFPWETETGRRFAREGVLKRFAKENAEFGEVYDYILNI